MASGASGCWPLIPLHTHFIKAHLTLPHSPPCPQAHGFWGILLLAAYPNAAFDLCGICCGHFQMPFWEFFGATLIGKGGIKVRAGWMPCLGGIAQHTHCLAPAALTRPHALL